MFNLDNYEPVEDRLAKFWADHKTDGRIVTRLLEVARNPDGRPLQYIVESEVWVADRCLATGLAEEIVGASPVNKTSALENAETSSLGRSLANAGYAKTGSRPSREEMAKVTRMTSVPADDEFYTHSVAAAPSATRVSDIARANAKQLWLISKLLEEKGVTEKPEQLGIINAILASQSLPAVAKGTDLPSQHVTAVIEGIKAMQTVEQYVAEAGGSNAGF